MKDFIKWLGVNEKVAKVVVWMLIIMVFLIITNTMLESVGFPHYAITYENIIKINIHKILDYIINLFLTLLNFYTIVLLVFNIKETKKIFKYALLYLILNIISTTLFGSGITQIFILVFLVIFGYLYSHKNKKYILYIIISIVLNTVIQGITYTYKVKFIDYTTINDFTKAILFSDYFIIMGIIILVKEIYLRKRGEKKCGEMDHQPVGSGSVNSKMKTNSPKN